MQARVVNLDIGEAGFDIFDTRSETFVTLFVEYQSLTHDSETADIWHASCLVS